MYRNKAGFYGEELLAPRPTPQVGGPHLVGCPRLLIQYIHSYPPYWRPFFHPQPEDAPCRGDRDPLLTPIIHISVGKYLGRILVDALQRVARVTLGILSRIM
jgi:hypothetical protein